MKKYSTIFTALLLAATITGNVAAQTNQRYYWVGGGSNNNWGTIANWSSSSGGLPAAGITNAPANVNTVVFDQNSFLSGDSVILINSGTVHCDSLIVQNCTKPPNFNFASSSANNITLSGSMFLQKGTIFTNTVASYSPGHTILKFVSSRAAETICTDSMEMPYNPYNLAGSNILLQGDTNTFWHLENYTQFHFLQIIGGYFDLVNNTHLRCTGSFSYTSTRPYNYNFSRYLFSGGIFSFTCPGNMNFDSVTVSGDISVIGNGNISFDSAVIINSMGTGNISVNGNGNNSLNDIRVDNTASVSGGGNNNLNNANVGGLSLSGSGIFNANNLTSGNVSISGGGVFYVNNSDIGGLSGGLSLTGSGNFYFNNSNIRAAGYVYLEYVDSFFFFNTIVDCGHWYQRGSMSAMQTANSLIKVRGTFKCESLSSFVNLNTYNNVEFYTAGSHSIEGGIFNKVTVLEGNAAIRDITADSLLLQDRGDYSFTSNAVTVNNYFEAKPQSCGGYLKLYTDNAASPRTLNLGNLANYSIERALIHDLKISRPVTAVNSYDWGNNTNISFTSAGAVGQDMYWTGGSGNWNDPAHWRLANGSPANCVPTLADNVFFDNTSSNGTAFDVVTALYINAYGSGNAYCNSMTWSNVPASCRLMTGSYGSLYINGSLSCSTSYFSGTVYFISDQPNNTITLNGSTISATVYFQSLSGSGGWKIMDDFLSGVTYFNSGHLDLSGQNVSFNGFYCLEDNALSGFSNRSPLRTIDFNNANINSGPQWEYVGGQQITSSHSANSLISVTTGPNTNFISKNNDYYYNVAHTPQLNYPNNNYCNSGTSYFNKITCNGTPATFYLNNGGGTIYPDSLVLATKATYRIYGNLPVRKYFSTLVLTPCESKTILGTTAGLTATIQMDTVNPVLSDRVQVQNAEITNLIITNGPYDVAYCDTFGTSAGWNNTITTSSYTGRYYWVGGTGNWGDAMHWASTSGGTPGSAGCVPTSSNTVVFDDNSFTAPSQHVYNDVPVYCDSMLWIGNDTIRPYFWAGSPTISGSLVLQKNMLWVGYNSLYMNSSRPNETMKINDRYYPKGPNGANGYGLGHIFFTGTGGWTLLDSLVTIGDIYFSSNGTLDFNGQYVEATNFSGGTGGTGVLVNRSFLNIKNSEIHVNSWSYVGDLVADSSYIYCNSMQGEQIATYTSQYHNVDLRSSITNGKYNKVTVLPSSSATITLIETDTLLLANTSNYTYNFQDTLRVNEAYYGMGTPCYQIYLQSLNKTTPAVFDIKTACANFSNDTLLIDNVYLHGIKALTGGGNAKLKKGSHSPDINEIGSTWGYGIGTNNYNQDWAAMEAYNSGGSTYFGGNRAFPCGSGFPDTLYSGSFAPSFGAIFEWRKGNINSAIIATTPIYAVNDTGTYYLTVNYGNGCTASDGINFSFLPSIDSISATICYGDKYTNGGFVNLDTAGVYSVHHISSAGCDSFVYLTLSVRLQVDTTFINAQICKGDVYNLNGFNETDTGLFTRIVPNLNGCDSVIKLHLSYYPSDTTTINAAICEGNTYNLNGFNETQAGVYYQTLPNILGCDSVIELVLSFSDLLTDTLNVTICQGDTFVYNGQSLSPTEPFSSFNFPFSTADGCDSVVTLNISLHPPISIELLDIKYEYCDERNGFIEVTTHNAAPPVNYLWNTGDPTPRIEHLVGDSIYSLTVTDGNSCHTDTSFFLGVCRTTLAVTKTDDTCNLATGSITLSVNSQYPATITYNWEGFPDANPALTGLKSGTYKVTVNDTFCTIEQTVIITGINGPSAEFEATPPIAPFGEEIQFTDKSTQGDGKITHWYWDFDDLQNSSAQNPKHRYQTSGQFMVLLKIEDEHGCTDSIEHEVLVAGELNFPNIFTPIGNNGTQYFFRPLETAGYFENFQIEVYDRWGVLVWQQHCKGGACPDYSNDSFWWNGTTKQGKPVSDGVYYWVVYASYSPAAKPLVKNGSVTVVR